MRLPDAACLSSKTDVAATSMRVDPDWGWRLWDRVLGGWRYKVP